MSHEGNPFSSRLRLGSDLALPNPPTPLREGGLSLQTSGRGFPFALSSLLFSLEADQTLADAELATPLFKGTGGFGTVLV